MIECSVVYKIGSFSDNPIESVMLFPCIPIKGSFVRFVAANGVDCYGRVQDIGFYPIQPQDTSVFPAVTIALGQVLPIEHLLTELKARNLT